MMKKIYSILLAVFCCSLSLMAEPYGLLINGSTKLEASSLSEQDFQGRDQFLVPCVELKKGDKVQLHDFANGAAWMCAIDPYGEYQKFSGGKAQGYLICNADGKYDFYIKLKFEDDMLYIGPAENCGGNNPGNNPGTKPIPVTSVPSACPDVMLQGFYWDSNQDNKGHGNTRWTTLQAQATEIAAYFDLVWLPPSAKSSGGVGYLPKQYNNQNSDWGKRSDLETLIKTLHDGGTKVIADIVINHIDGKDGWCSFYTQNFGELGSYVIDGSYICKNDEMNTDPQAGDCNGQATGPYDDGYGSEANYGAGRDLAHDSEKVREMCRAYTKWMVDEMKYDGFRYDYCKGFHNSHIGDYNANAGAYFSVMEYWDGNANVLWNRIQDAGCNTLTFDFGVKYDALNRGIAAGNYSGCKAPGLLGLGKGKYAVTFVDSHDSYQRDDNEFCGYGNSMKNKDKVLQANAFILSMPGVPCVFYPHWKEFKSQIGVMILARKAVGVHSESAVSDEGDNGGYRATITGTNGTLILELGNKVSSSQTGYTKAASGNGYAMWIKTNSAVAPELIVTPGTTIYKTETLEVQMNAVGGAGKASIYYTLDGTDPKTSTTKKIYAAAITIKGNVTIKAYAEANGVATEVQKHVYTYQEPQETPLTVRFYPPTSWENVYLYAWDTNGKNILGAWPGKAWTTKDKEGWLYYTFDEGVKEMNVIFNNGEGVQSADILVDQDVCYTWDELSGMEVLSDECGVMEVDFQLVIEPHTTTYKTDSLVVTMKTVGNTEPATIYYTLDGSDPTSSANVMTYVNPIAIQGTVTLCAYAEADGIETDVQTYTYTYQEPQKTALIVKFFPPLSWEVVNLYAWDVNSNPLLGAWPGMTWTTKDEEGWLYYIFDQSLREVNVIFNNGTVQSADIYVDEDVCYVWNEDEQKAILDPECSGTDVENVYAPEDMPMLDVTLPMYNVLGQPVDADYHGVVIQNGHKYIR